MKLVRQKESYMTKKKEKKFSVAESFRTIFSVDSVNKLAKEAAREHQESVKKRENKNS